MPTIGVPDERTVVPRLERMDSVLRAILDSVMKKGVDYDTLPGATKPTLLKPGAETLALAFDLVPDTQIVKSVERTTEQDTIPYFQYDAVCRLYNSKGEFVGNGVGSCNSAEAYYSRKWVFEEELPKTVKNPEELQTRGEGGRKQYRVPVSKEEVFGVANAVMKKAKKRAFVDAVLTVTSTSGLFSQDLADGEKKEEDDDDDGVGVTKPAESSKERKEEQQQHGKATPASRGRRDDSPGTKSAA